MRRSLVVAALAGLSACVSGVENNISSGKSVATLTTDEVIADQVSCLDVQMSRSGFRYDIKTTDSGWELTTYVFGGPVVGWFPKSKAIRKESTIDYFMDAADFGIDAYGVRSVVVPILKSCS